MEKYRDYVLRAVVEGTPVTVYVASSKHLVEAARRLHGTSPVATAALGRALTLVGIMGVVLSEGQRVSLQICCRGPLRGIFVQGNWKGEVRGYVSQPLLIVPSREDGKLNVETAVGEGSQLIVVRDLGFGKPWVGSVEMPRGGIAYDLAYYFTLSEQLPTACSAGVYVGTQGEVLSAGGFMVHTPSGTDEGVVKKLEQNVLQLQPVSLEFFGGKSPEDLLAELLWGLSYRLVGKSPLLYRCSCSMERAKHVLLLLGKEEIQGLLQREGLGEVRCAFCNQVYLFTREELKSLLEEAE
ncbi:MAG: Hsp33 family molecular chaperone HslO [Atribacterota bacterium]